MANELVAPINYVDLTDPGQLKVLNQWFIEIWKNSKVTSSLPGANQFEDDLWRILDNGNNTRKFGFQAGGITAGQTRIATIPDRNFTLDNLTAATTTNLTGFIKGNGANLSAQGSIDVTDLSGNIWKVLYTDGSGDVTELALGASGFLKTNGAAAAPAFATIDISDDTNLAVTSPMVLTDDTLSYTGDYDDISSNDAATDVTGSELETLTDTSDADSLHTHASFKVLYVFEDTDERDAFFVTNPSLLIEDALIVIKDTTPPPTPGVRSYNFSKAYNSQYLTTTLV